MTFKLPADASLEAYREVRYRPVLTRDQILVNPSPSNEAPKELTAIKDSVR